MKTNYFKILIPPTILTSLLTELCIVHNKCFIMDMPAYHKGIHRGLIQKFMEDCRPYYTPSKMFYTTNKLTYKSFLTVVRHICKIHSIEYSHQIQYSHSIYQIVYKIQIPDSPVVEFDGEEQQTESECDG